ncbi:MAG: hypothetical protein WBE13_10735 [Candidatus Acidiferrum sp.]
MRIKSKYILGLAILTWVGIGCWQFASWEISNLELREDLRDIASQLGPRVGFDPLSSDGDIRKAVIRKAAYYDIELKPEEVTVKHSADNKISDVYVAVDYKTAVKLPGFSFHLHFVTSSER